MAPKNKLSEKYPVMFFDIETVANEEALEMIDDPKPPKNIKDPDKIANAVAEKKQEIIDMAPLDSDLATIAAIGYAIGKDGPIIADVVSKKLPEKKVIENFWAQFALVNSRCSGYNIIAFDLPFIMKRSFALGVYPSIIPNLARFRTEPITDLQMILCNWDYRNAHKFKWVMKRYGIEILDEGSDGSMVKDMSEKELKKYVTSDVNGVRELYYKMKGFYFL